MAINNFKSFGIGAGANVISQADYEALAALLTGFQSGKASSAQINKALRQSSTMAYVLAQFISDSAAVDVLDNGTPATILANLKSAMTALTPGRLLGPPIIMTASGTYTPSPGTKKIRIRAVGGGGGGGGGPAAASGQQNAAQGGQSGAYAEVVANVSSSSYAVTVGTAGVRGTATTAATAGGASSVAGILSVPGGAAGAQGVSNAVSITISNNAASTTYPTVTTGTTVVSIPANPGEPFIVVGINSAQMKGGRGGSNPFGIGGAPGVSGPGSIGRGSGAGGGGCSQAQGGAGDVGGDGLAGLVVIEEYA